MWQIVTIYLSRSIQIHFAQGSVKIRPLILGFLVLFVEKSVELSHFEQLHSLKYSFQLHCDVLFLRRHGWPEMPHMATFYRKYWWYFVLSSKRYIDEEQQLTHLTQCSVYVHIDINVWMHHRKLYVCRHKKKECWPLIKRLFFCFKCMTLRHGLTLLP